MERFQGQSLQVALIRPCHGMMSVLFPCAGGKRSVLCVAMLRVWANDGIWLEV